MNKSELSQLNLFLIKSGLLELTNKDSFRVSGCLNGERALHETYNNLLCVLKFSDTVNHARDSYLLQVPSLVSSHLCSYLVSAHNSLSESNFCYIVMLSALNLMNRMKQALKNI